MSESTKNSSKMKVNCFVLILVVMGLYEQVMSQGAADTAAFRQMQVACIRELNINGLEASLIVSDKPVTYPTEQYQCYHNCIYKKMGMINADGKVNYDNILKTIQTHFPEIAVDKIKTMLITCGAASSTSACDYAYNFETCMANGLKG